jgi:hypothetical protein
MLQHSIRQEEDSKGEIFCFVLILIIMNMELILSIIHAQQYLVHILVAQEENVRVPNTLHIDAFARIVPEDHVKIIALGLIVISLSIVNHAV